MEGKMNLFCKGKNHKMERFMEVCLLLLLYKETGHGYVLAEQLTYFGFSKEELNIGSLYRTLRKMEKEASVISYWEEGGQGPKKRVYQITEAGKKRLDNWIEVLEERRTCITKLIDTYKKTLAVKTLKK
jgi:poly-beta-hydroxybutyrate-responsive repressor